MVLGVVFLLLGSHCKLKGQLTTPLETCQEPIITEEPSISKELQETSTLTCSAGGAPGVLIKGFESLAAGGGDRSKLRAGVSGLARVLVPGHEVQLAEHGSAGLGRVAAAGSTEVKGCWAESWLVRSKEQKETDQNVMRRNQKTSSGKKDNVAGGKSEQEETTRAAETAITTVTGLNKNTAQNTTVDSNTGRLVSGCTPVCGQRISVCAWVAQRQLAALGLGNGCTPVCGQGISVCAWVVQRQLAALEVGSLVPLCFTVWRVHSRVLQLAKPCVRLGLEVAAGGASSTPSPTGSLASGRVLLLRSHGNSYAGLWILAALCFGCWQQTLVRESDSETGGNSGLNFSELD